MPREQCPKCSALLTERDFALGQLTECPHCASTFPTETIPENADLWCPKCAASLTEQDYALGQLTRCPHCASTFATDHVPENAEEELYDPDGVAAYLRPDYEPEDPAERALVVAAARMRVETPALGMMATGLVGAVSTVMIGVAIVFSYLEDRKRGWTVNNNEIASAIGFSIGLCLYFLIIAAGGRELRRLGHRQLCMLGATLSILSIGVCGVWTVISIPGAIFGARAFAALSSLEVKHAMRWKQQEREAARGV